MTDMAATIDFPNNEFIPEKPGYSQCWVHHQYEQIAHGPAGPFIVCFECGHVYNTAEQLVKEYNELAPEDTPERTVDEIFFCPNCLHDF